MNRHFDFIIIGGGCAGLSLAFSMANKRKNKRILILESRQEYLPDRTWCFWNVQKHPFESLVEHSWKSWEVQWNGKKISSHSSQYEYQCISSEKFYQWVTSELKNNLQVTLLMNSKVVRMTQETTAVLIETAEGTFTCNEAFDSRQEVTKTQLIQHFHGWKIRSKKAIFNPTAVTLMDFDVDQESGLNFMYLLPYTPHCALVESTYLSPKVLPKIIYENAIRRYVEERYSTTDYEILWKEEGALPLGKFVKKREKNRIVPIGTNAGWARASTGYAFLAIQAGVKNLLDSRSETLKKSIDDFLDQIFVAYLSDEPQRSPELFFNLFKKNSPDQLVRFLTSQWSYSDLLRILFSMPKGAMIKRSLK